MTEVPAEKCLLAWHILLMMEYLQKTSYLADIVGGFLQLIWIYVKFVTQVSSFSSYSNHLQILSGK
jgi:hypothetical protein